MRSVITSHRFPPSHRLRLLRHALLLISPVTFFGSFYKFCGRLFRFRLFPSSHCLWRSASYVNAYPGISTTILSFAMHYLGQFVSDLTYKRHRATCSEGCGDSLPRVDIRIALAEEKLTNDFPYNRCRSSLANSP